MKKRQLMNFNILFEEAIAILIQIGLTLLMKFQQNPKQIGLVDPTHILHINEDITDEDHVFHDNIEKFKLVREFVVHANDAHSLMTN